MSLISRLLGNDSDDKSDDSCCNMQIEEIESDED